MTENKSLVEEAIIQMKNLEEVIAENAKGILASTMKQEIKELVKESLTEADEEEEDVEDEMDVELDDEDEDESMDDEFEDEDEFEMSMDTEMDDEDVIDLTNQPMSTVMKVFKKMGPEDQIEVQKDDAGNIHLTDNETDNEYMIMAESDMDEYFGDMDEEEYDEDEFELSDTETEEILGDLLPEEETMYEIEMDDNSMEEEFYESEEIDYDFEEMMEMEDDEEIMYELEMDDESMEEEYMMESKKSQTKGFTYGKVVDYPTKKMAHADEAPYTGKGPKYSFDKKSPSLKGEFKEGKYGMNKADKSKTHKGEEDYTGKEGMKSKTHKGEEDFTGKKGMKSKTHKGMDFEKMETKEASRTLGSGSYFRKGGLPKQRAHSKFNANIEESVSQQELEILREKNEEYRKALNVFRNKLNEVAIFNSNLAYATRLFTEHSTSKQEKINILQRFDSVETLKESKNLYRTIKDELGSTKTQQVNESIERSIQKTPSTGSAINLIESKTYENPQFMRMKDLMSKLK